MAQYYDLPQEQLSISLLELASKNAEAQKDIMRTWFFQNYQDPVHECPYNSREGGYAYVYGGPYESIEELQSEFGGHIPDEVIDDLAGELDADCSEWSGISDPRDYDDYFLDIASPEIDPLIDFKESMQQLRGMLELSLGGAHHDALIKMIYISLITSLETYLAQTFIGEIESSDEALRSFVETTPDYKQTKISLAEIFKEHESIREHAKEHLLGLIWHNLAKLKPMFKASLGIHFPESMGALIKATHVRHDLVHRGGKTKEGKEVQVSQQEVANLATDLEKFVNHIHDQSSKQPAF
jgi:hypothetical protein